MYQYLYLIDVLSSLNSTLNTINIFIFFLSLFVFFIYMSGDFHFEFWHNFVKRFSISKG